SLKEYQAIVEYHHSKTIPDDIQHDPKKKFNFIRRCKKFEVDENDCLYIQPVVKDGVVSEKRPNHHEYHKTFSAISEKHIEITQEEVKAYVNQCSACAINTTIKEKVDMRPVVSIAPWQHVQIDLIDFRDFIEVNDDFAWLLTCVCVFSKFLVVAPLKNKEAKTAPEPTYVPGTTAASETAPEPTYASETITTSETAPEPTNTSGITAASETASEPSKISKITVTTETASEPSNAYGTTALDVTIASGTTTLDTMTSEAGMEKHILQMLETHQSINASLEKYRKKLCCQSVHKKKTVNNTIEPGTEIAIAPDHDMNQQTHKRKLQPTFSVWSVFKSLKSNNHTAVVKINSKDIQ
ncbi:11480_t:CDS:2, partial [Cetraspora pellucida]